MYEISTFCTIIKQDNKICFTLIKTYFEIFCEADGEWSEWNQWTDCSLTCDGGTAFRSKTCIYPDPEYRGKECSLDYPYEQTVKCNELPCNGKLLSQNKV